MMQSTVESRPANGRIARPRSFSTTTSLTLPPRLITNRQPIDQARFNQLCLIFGPNRAKQPKHRINPALPRELILIPPSPLHRTTQTRPRIPAMSARTVRLDYLRETLPDGAIVIAVTEFLATQMITKPDGALY